MNAVSTLAEPFTPHPQYLRLFGHTPPELAIIPAASNSPEAAAPDGPPPLFFCDPKEAAAGHFSYSARTLGEIAALRARHIEKGRTPESDAAHGWAHFKHLSDEAFRDAIAARSPETRRKRLMIAAAIIVALIDAEDFATHHKEAADAPAQR